MRRWLLLIALARFLAAAPAHSAPPSSPIVLTFLDQGWFEVQYREQRARELDQFTRETGIKVEMLPAPENASEQLALWRSLLEKHSAVPDVCAVDVIWPEILGDYLLDLKPYLSREEVASYFPELIAINTVRGRLIGLPYALAVGLLYYRRDLLRLYGYTDPPTTWDELERMAARIQAGERAKGHRDFWGYVWEGGQSEALVCNALEWQVSQGGGNIINQAGDITVNNPRAIFSWARAARWLNTISPRSVTEYTEFDALNVWDAGRAAFMRNWNGAYTGSANSSEAFRDRIGAATLPAGSAGYASALGGNSFGVSRYSLHRNEAVRLVRYLCGRDVQRRRCLKESEAPTIPDLYSDPQLKTANPDLEEAYKAMHGHLAVRPSKETGRRYPKIAAAYSQAVHSVLTGQKTAAAAARDLAKDLNARGFAP